MSRRTGSRRTWPTLTVALSLLVSLLVLPTPRTVAADAGPAVAAPPSPTFALSQADQDPGAFVISGFGGSATLLVAIGFVDPPAGVSFSLPVTTGLTASFGYELSGNHTQISFTGTMAAANTALAAMRVSTGPTAGGITIRVTASENQDNVFYNPINGHYYEYVARAGTFAYAPANTANSAVHLAEGRTLFGVRGYLATITDAQEQAFVFANVEASNIWIAGSDAFEPLKERVAGYSAATTQSTTEGKWYWIAGPDAGTQFWSGATGGKWIDRDTGAELSASDANNAAVARYENWCHGNAGQLDGSNLAAGATFTLKVRGTSPRSSNVEPNNSSSGEHYLLEKWSGAPCWNDWGRTADGIQGGFLVEYSEDWGDPNAPAGAWNERRGRFTSTDSQPIASATVTALVDNAPRDVTATATTTTAAVSWSAPAAGTVTQYTVTATPGGLTCTTAATSCTVSGLSPTTSYTFTVRATFADASTADSLPSPAVETAAATGIVMSAGSARLAGSDVTVDPGLELSGSEPLSGATAVIEGSATGDTLACTTPLPTGISCSFNASTRVLTLTGTASVAAYQTALRGVTFSTTSLDDVDREVRFSLAGTAFFLEATGHYYEWVTASGISWTDARDRAADMANYGTSGRPRGMSGLQGYLVTVTSQAENDALRSRLAGQGWMGASDALDDKQWRWVTGPEGLEDGGKGRWFYTQSGYNPTGANTCGVGPAAAALQPKDGSGAVYFSNWASGEPNDFPGGCAGGEDYAHFLSNGQWNDYPVRLSNIAGYVVEYGGMPGDPSLPAPLTATRTVAVLPAQTITSGLGASTTFTYGDTLTFSPSASSGLTVSVVVSGAGCTLDDLGGGTLALTWAAAGSCTVTASQPGIDLPPDQGGWRAATPVVSTVTTSRRPLTVTGLTATSRVYDGTTTVALSGTAAIQAGGVLSADTDDVALSGAPIGALPSAAVGQGRSVTVSGLTLTGTKAGRYTAVTNVSVDITRRPIAVTGSFAVADRVYDGSSATTVIGTGLGLEAQDGDRGRIAGDTLGLTGLTAQADGATPGTRTATLTAAALSGTAASNYLLSFDTVPTATFTISGRLLTVSSGSFTVIDKVYDGTDTATIVPNGLALAGFVGGDSMADVTWTPTGRFAVTSAGADRTVELVGGAVLGGAKGAGYVLDVTGSPTATATITPRTVTIVGATAQARPYDGTTAVVISGASLANTVAGDAVSLTNTASGTASSRDAGTRAVATTMALAGADATNYRLAGQPSLSITITPLPVDVTMNALAPRPYDGSTALSLPADAFSVSGTIPGERIVVSGTAQLSSRAAGTRTVTLAGPSYTPGAGTDLGNYTLPSSATGTITITPRPVSIVGATVVPRTWDGTSTAVVTGARLDGVRAGDDVSLSGASSGVFASSRPGTHEVRSSPTLVGADAANYRLTVLPLSGTISRAPATLRITGGLTQFADGTARDVRAAVSPTSAGRVVVTYSGGRIPSEPGTFGVTVALESDTHEAAPLSATLTIQGVDTLLSPATAPTSSDATPAASDTERREQLLARLAVRSDGSLALPEIGPVLHDDGTSPALRPQEQRVLRDGEPLDARISVIDDRMVRVRMDGDDAFAIDLQATGTDGATPLSVDANGDLLLDRGGFVAVAGSGFLLGSTAEAWMFSTATFLGTAIVGPDGSFAASFPIDLTLATGEHTLQLNGIGADTSVRSTSLGVRIEDPAALPRERVMLATVPGPMSSTSPLWLLLLAAALGALGALATRRSRREAD